MAVTCKLSENWVKRRIESEDRGTFRLPRIGWKPRRFQRNNEELSTKWAE
jgi:hypothetical protein